MHIRGDMLDWVEGFPCNEISKECVPGNLGGVVQKEDMRGIKTPWRRLQEVEGVGHREDLFPTVVGGLGTRSLHIRHGSGIFGGLAIFVTLTSAPYCLSFFGLGP